MTDRIRLVQNDTRPALVIALSDDTTGSPIDVSNTGTVVRMKFREVGASEVKAEIVCAKLITAGNSTPGAAGVVQASWPAGSLDTVGTFEAEVEITFADGTIHTVVDRVEFLVRDDF